MTEQAATTEMSMAEAIQMPDIRRAGVISPKHEDDSVSAAMKSLRFQRPKTPENVEHYRRSYYNNRPGMKATPLGIRDMKLPGDEFRYGIASKSGEHASDLMKTRIESEIGEYFEARKESIYASRRRQPLGRAFNRGHVLPDATKDSNFKFGVTSTASEDAKHILYPSEKGLFLRKDDPEAVELDQKLRQKIDLHYDWDRTGCDPASTRFGHPPEVIPISAGDLLHQQESMLVGLRRRENYNADNKFPVGKAKPLSGKLRELPYDHVFGLMSKKNEWGAKDCISGDYAEEDNVAPPNLGRSVPVKGRKLSDIDTSVAAGYSAALPGTKRATASDLLNPPKFSFGGISEKDFTEERSFEELRSLFALSGFPCSDENAARIRDLLRPIHGGGGSATILSFQSAYNEVHGYTMPS